MYIFYQHHKDANGKTVLTELKLSSYATRWAIYWQSMSEDTLFKLCNPLLKTPPISMRSYDDPTKVWTYMENWGEQVLSKIKAVTTPLGGLITVEIEDLQLIASQSLFDIKKTQKPQRPEDFFYNPTGGTAAAGELSKEAAAAKLVAEFAVTDKSTYRAAALKYHPDRNNGDGSRMAELNMLWRVVNT